MALTHALSTNNYGPAKFIVTTSANVANGTHILLQTAIDDASSGDTIFLRDSITENVTLKAGVNISAWVGGTLNTPTITGKLTMTTAGTCNISGIKLVSNGAEFLSVTGIAASIVNLTNCYLTTAFDPGITFSSSSASSAIILNNCQGDISASAKKFFANSSAGTLGFNVCNILNSGASTTASTSSSGGLVISKSGILFPITTSGTSTLTLEYNNQDTSALNVTTLTCGGSGSSAARYCEFVAGSASSVSISSTLAMIDCNVLSSNTNSVTGAGTLTYSSILFQNSSGTDITTISPLNNSIGSSRSLVTGATNDATYQSSIIGGQSWTWGLDNSDSDAYALSSNATLGTTNVMRVATTGEINYPLQSAFLAVKTTKTDDQTGAGGIYTFIATSEIFDQNSDFDGTSTYTCPVTSRVNLYTGITITGITVLMTTAACNIQTSNRIYRIYSVNAGAVMTAGTVITPQGSVFADMDAGDTAIIIVQISNGAGNTADIDGAAAVNWFGGNISC